MWKLLKRVTIGSAFAMALAMPTATQSAGNPCARTQSQPCNPCAPKEEMKQQKAKRKAAQPCNPCARTQSQPCNPCAAENPCGRK